MRNSRRLSRPFLLFCLMPLWIAATALNAQVAAKQGTPAVSAKQGASTKFNSPMILETVFLPADRSLWKGDEWISGKAYVDLEQFSCDDVHVKKLRMRPRLIADGQMVLVEVRAVILNVNSRESHDKRVTIRFDLLNGDEFVSGVTTKPKKASDTDSGGYGIGASLTVPTSALRTDPMTTLRLTVTAEDY
jgi:hypothetical protein